jgi:hypothetical protein
MSSLPGQILRWPYRTCVDSLYTGPAGSGEEQQVDGGMMALSNLVPDPLTTDSWVCRPASIELTSFSGFTSPGFISALLVVGNYAYGMIAETSGTYAGLDVPFVYNIPSGSFETIQWLNPTTLVLGAIPANTLPTSPSTSGAWTPPSLALVGTKVVVCHPGFNGVTNYVGWIDISTPTAPLWSAGNTAINSLPCVPSWVAQFSGRAYYLCNPTTGLPGVLASDSLDPTTMTNANYVLTFGDNIPLVAAFGLALDNQLGGIIQSLLVFKSNNIYQITGDPATSSWVLNSLNVGIGTNSPLSICATPEGIAFVAPDGMRQIDFNAHVSDPIGMAGTGITAPFKYSSVPSRICAACNATTVRITTRNLLAAGAQQEWCYDLQRQIWYGPHTFPASLIQAYGLRYVMAPVGVVGSLWISDVIPLSTSTYTENGAGLTWATQTALLPPQQNFMTNYNIVESQQWAAFDPNASSFVVTAYDENANLLNTCTVSGAIVGGGVWGSGLWGTMLWGGVGQALSPRRLAWTQPLVFARCSIGMTGASAPGVYVSDFIARVEQLGYVQNQ